MALLFPPPPPHPTDQTADHRATLARLAAIGLDIAERIGVEAQTPPEPGEPSRLLELTQAFERVATSVRRTIALDEKLGQPAPVRRDSDQLPREAAKRRALREVEDVINVLADPADHERLLADLFDRFDRPEMDDEIDNRPIGDVIMDIRRDLGLENRPGQEPWTRRTSADWANLCARAAGRPPSAQSVPPNDNAQLHPSRFRGKPAPA